MSKVISNGEASAPIAEFSQPRPEAQKPNVHSKRVGSSGMLSELENITQGRETDRTGTRPRKMFSSLKEFGDKTFKFQQRKSISALSRSNFSKIGLSIDEKELESLKEGTCESLALGWLASKLQAGHGLSDKLQSWAPHHHGVPSQTGNASPPNSDANIHVINGGIQLEMARAEIESSRNDTSTHEYFDSIKLTGLAGADFLKPEIGIIEVKHGGPDEKQIQAHTALELACAQLPPGTGFNINFSILDINKNFDLAGRHSISIYRDSDSNIHFFDPNIGEYKVKDPKSFFESWENATANGRGWRLEILTDGTYPDDIKMFARK
ncbi:MULTISPECIES: YopT-type cysteine protease domain-containing protein [unclassified Burkholderia]|uniref:YopT-type cysteine protease domain-containing protein n=1 Tax=unclassified Burkholderia TaxID=2613784 RepID=UPI001E5D2D6D|nr:MULTISPECIES: YopT-type cysteine protease domain-containing protein [unclassified Burkholderia]UEP30555.1 YopT-type cysteine protease domain-containing protein [Burkholderia sp. B21-007]UEP44129.1 YopT-type cysteine protease domain-containing protein [Burkholderia sp. B21-005]